MTSHTVLVYKIAGRTEWAQVSSAGHYAGSADDQRDGFIHLSTVDQLAGTLARHFAGRDDLVLVAFSAEALGHGLRWEPSRAGQLFPHFYGALPPGLALTVSPIERDSDGRHHPRLPSAP